MTTSVAVVLKVLPKAFGQLRYGTSRFSGVRHVVPVSSLPQNFSTDFHESAFLVHVGLLIDECKHFPFQDGVCLQRIGRVRMI